MKDLTAKTKSNINTLANLWAWWMTAIMIAGGVASIWYLPTPAELGVMINPDYVHPQYGPIETKLVQITDRIFLFLVGAVSAFLAIFALITTGSRQYQMKQRSKKRPRRPN